MDLPSLEPTAQKLRPDNLDSQKAKDKRFRDVIDFVNATQAYIHRLQKKIEDLERGFRERDGDAWREKLALRVLGEDDIPQRRVGESMDGYRERLEPLLIAQMLNDDGSIKARYKNDLELSDYAQWAQKQQHLSVALELSNPGTSPERRDEILDQNRDLETLIFTDREATESNIQTRVKDNADTIRDNLGVQEQSIDHTFFQPKS